MSTIICIDLVENDSMINKSVLSHLNSLIGVQRIGVNQYTIEVDSEEVENCFNAIYYIFAGFDFLVYKLETV